MPWLGSYKCKRYTSCTRKGSGHETIDYLCTYTAENLEFLDTPTQEKINISVCVNGIPYINGAQEMGVHEQIASVT